MYVMYVCVHAVCVCMHAMYVCMYVMCVCIMYAIYVCVCMNVMYVCIYLNCNNGIGHSTRRKAHWLSDCARFESVSHRIVT